MKVESPNALSLEKEFKADITTTISASPESADEAGISPVDRAFDRKIVRKCDLFVLPPVFVLFMVTFWDRVNIGSEYEGR